MFIHPGKSNLEDIVYIFHSKEIESKDIQNLFNIVEILQPIQYMTLI